MFVREMQDGCEVEQVLLVRDVQAREDHVRLMLADRTGAVPAVVSHDPAPAVKGAAVWVCGRVEDAELVVTDLRPAGDGEYDLGDLLAGPPKPVEELERDLREVVATIQDPQLLRLLDAILGEGSATWGDYRDWPAAKRYHQAYRHGLLEHSVGVAKGVHLVCGTFPGIDHDVAVTGALLHDIGKLEAYDAIGHTIDLTDAGKLQGEIPLGYYRVRRAIEDLDGLPGGARTRGAAHHPQPPRLARARQPGRPVHARGDARARDRQPRRQARLVRPPREGAARRRALVALRQGDRHRRVLRRARDEQAEAA